MMKKYLLHLICGLAVGAGLFQPSAYGQLGDFNKATDIFLPQFDSNRDPDDLHSIAAVGCMLAHADYAGINYLAAHGAYGDQTDSNFIASPELFSLVFGDENTGWVNASPQDPSWNGAVAKVVARVKPILLAGGKAWVAEAGQSDFTADWVRELIVQGVPEATIKANVIVVQHSDWNEDHTTDADLTYVQNKCAYQVINDGNGTSTARDPGAPATPSYRSTNTDFLPAALITQNRKARAYWLEADWRIMDEGYLPDHSSITVGGVDFSDAVESHWIFGSPTDCNTIQKFWDKFVTNLPVPNDDPENPTGRDYGNSGEITPPTGTWLEAAGMVIVEMEHGDLHEDWTIRPSTYLDDPTMAGSMGDGWIEWAGPEKFSTTLDDSQANGISVYRFKITTAGEYTFRWRSKQYDSVEAGDQGNDTYVKFATGTPQTMTGSQGGTYTITKFTKVWVQSQASWSWGTNFEPSHGDFVTNPKVHYDAGVHEIWIAGRSKGHAIDRFVLYHSTANGTTAQNAPESERQMDTASYVYEATNDFPVINAGTVPYYKDNGNNALAINAANESYRGLWARAELTFDGSTGSYDVMLTSLKELDGECSYRLLINGSVIGEVTNTTTTVDYQEQDHVFQNVSIPAGATVAVESITHSNGQVAEGTGFAWARGRWRTLTLVSDAAGTGLSVSAGADQTIFYPPTAITLTGSASDDSEVVSTVWSQLSGPNTAELSGTNSLTLTASNLVEGAYVFSLTATDNETNSVSDEVTVTVENEPPIIPNTSLWKEDFEGAALGATSGNNQTLAGTVVQTANKLASEVVTAPPAFTSASGNVILISTGDNSYAALRTPATIDLSSYYFRSSDSYSISFDLYIPAALSTAVGGVNFRWMDANNTVNGPTDSAYEVSGPGVYHIEYTGSFPVNTGGSDFMPTSVRPFIWFHQDGAIVDDYVYMDNLDFKIRAPNYAPEFDSDPIDAGYVAAESSFIGNLSDYASDPNNDALMFAHAGGPDWLSIATNGVMSGIPGESDQGTNTFTVSVEDPDGESDTATLIIFVDEPEPSLPLTTIWEEDFEGAALGATSGSNANLPGSDIETRNTLTSEVVAAPAGFTNASGNVILLSTGTDAYAAIRPIGNTIDLSAYLIQEGDAYTLSFDMYIPATLSAPVGGVNFRWKNATVTDNGPTLTTYETSAAGAYHVVYTGTFTADTRGIIPTSVGPFIWFDQDGAAAAEYVYFDNLKFEIGTPDAEVKTGFAKFEEDYSLTGGVLGDDDDDGQNNLLEFALGGNPTNDAITGWFELIFAGAGNARFSVPQRTDIADNSISYVVEASTNIVSGTWMPLVADLMITNSIDGTTEYEEVQYQFWAGGGSPKQRFLRLKVTKE